MINFLIGGAIFAYAIYILIKFVKTSKQGGACAHCAVKKSCNCGGCSPVKTSYTKNTKLPK